MRVGVVDLGTNSTRLLVADVDADRVDEVSRHTVITRLGEGVDERRKLLPLPVARVRNALSDYRRELEQLGAERVLAIGTSAIRDAENGEAFLGEIEWSYGFATRLLSGDEEADLTRRGVANGRAVDDDTLVLDVGGGSTELITSAERTSIDVGSVRLTERHLRSDPPTRSASRGRSRPSRPWSSAATTSSASTGTGSRARPSTRCSRASPPSQSPSAASCPGSSRSARR
jgi:exopolyphosphatase/guanosine-5'-triphosphate,3'-diphosphate pyrophosphatase